MKSPPLVPKNSTIKTPNHKQLSSFHFDHRTNKIFIMYTLLPVIPLSIIAILSLNPNRWMGSEIHHFYIELFGVILAGILAFYYILHVRKLNDKFRLFVGIGFFVSTLLIYFTLSYRLV